MEVPESATFSKGQRPAHPRAVCRRNVNFEFLKVSQDGEWQVFVPSIAFGLEGVTRVKFLGGFLGFTNKTVMAVCSEKIIGALLPPADFRAAFNFHLAMLLNQSGAVLHVPAKRAKKWIKIFKTEFGLVITVAFKFGQIAPEFFNETIQFFFKGFKAGCIRHGE